jgi:hypothetical protein
MLQKQRESLLIVVRITNIEGYCNDRFIVRSRDGVKHFAETDDLAVLHKPAKVRVE